MNRHLIEKAFQLDVGSEWLIAGLISAPVAAVVSVGKVEGKVMPQFVPVYNSQSDQSTRWQIVSVNSDSALLIVLLPKSQVTKQTQALCLALANRRKMTIQLVGSIYSREPELQYWFVTPEGRSALSKLVPLDPKEFSIALTPVSSPSALAPVSTPLSTLAVPTLQGNFERVQDGYAIGWVINTSQPDVMQWVLVRDEFGNLVGMGEANLRRADLEMLGVTTAPCGFQIALSPVVFDGQPHQLSLHQTNGLPYPEVECVPITQLTDKPPLHLLFDSATFMALFDKAWPGCEADLRLMAEQMRLSLESGVKAEVVGGLAVLSTADPRISWLLAMVRAEIELLDSRPKAALQLLASIDALPGADKSVITSARQLILLSHSEHMKQVL